jgi:dihydroorotate dehydrogenase electron transfer subunit
MSTAPHRIPAQSLNEVLETREVAEGIFVLRFRSSHVSAEAAPGQFVNIRCGDGCLPLLRRPFSISRVDGDVIELMFNVVGHGTRMLASKRPGDMLDVLGPLGKPFGIEGSFGTALLVGGGLGTAPFPFLTDALRRAGKMLVTFVGARTARQISTDFLSEVHIATDDGSRGFHGTVVALLKSRLGKQPIPGAKIFGCGPTRMLEALSKTAEELSLECELSLEGDMACGMGLCQGCPVERSHGEKKYALVCTEGPTFDSKEIVLRP